MFCKKCGAELPEGIKFCAKCGCKIDVPTPAPEQDIAPAPQPATPQAPVMEAPAQMPSYVQTPQPQTEPAPELKPEPQPSFVPATAPENSNAKPPKKKKRGKAFIAVVLVFVLLIGISSIFGGGSGSDSDGSQAASGGAAVDGKYTVMVYMVGSDLESGGNYASEDLDEMRNSNIDPDNTNLVVYAGGAYSWGYDISRENKNILKMSKDESGDNYFEIKDDEPAENMGEASSLSGFINYCVDTYPADHYALICWDHGGAVNGQMAYGIDELTKDFLYLPEIDSALSSTPFNGDNKLDFIGFDACLMATMDVAYTASNYANYLVASQESESSLGWSYDFLDAFNTTSDPVDISKSIIDCTAAAYDKERTAMFNPDVTMSCVDLSRIPDVINSNIEFNNYVADAINANDYSAISYTSKSYREFGVSKGEHLGLYDAVGFMNSYSCEDQSIVDNVINSVNNAVVHNYSNIDGCCGLNLYFPESAYVESEYPGDSDYAKSINNLTKSYKNLENIKTDWKLDKVSVGKDNATIKLNDEQMANLYDVYYTVLVDNSTEEYKAYTPVMSKCRIVPNADGEFTVPLAPNIMVADGSNDSMELLYSVEQTQSYGDKATYKSIKSAFYTDATVIGHGDYKFINLSLSADKDNMVTVNQAVSLDENSIPSNKNTVYAEDWGDIGDIVNRYEPKDAPYTEWENDDWIIVNHVPIDGEVSFELKPTTIAELDFICQIVFVDKQGKEHATNTFDLKNQYDAGVKLVEYKTDKGVLKFDVKGDQAKLVDYSGKDTEINIPSKVGNATVTEIGGAIFRNDFDDNRKITKITIPDTVTKLDDYAFAYCEKLKSINIPDGIDSIPNCCFFGCDSLAEIKLPDTIKSIGNSAFRGNSEMKSIDLPENVEYLGKGFIYGVWSLESVTFGGDNTGKNYKIVDNMILTNDGKTLIAALVDNTATTITVPDGVEVIEKLAFISINEPFLHGEIREDVCQVTTLVLPSSLRVISDFAFQGLITLKEINIPEGVKEIGVCAFSSGFYQTAKLDKLVIPASVEKIKNKAFEGFTFDSYEVNEKNKRYASVDGKLMNKGKDVEIIVDGRELEE